MKKKLFHKFYSLSLALSLSAVSIAGATFAWIYTADYLTVDADGATIVEYFDSNTTERSNGTETNPFVITTPTHLYNLSMLQYYGAFEGNQYYFQLGKTSGEPFYTDDSQQTESSTLNMENVPIFYPIGTRTNPFIGIFNGREEVIQNLTVTNPEDAPLQDVGFFGYVDASGTTTPTAVSDFLLKDIKVVSNNPFDDPANPTYIGLIAGNVNGGNLTNVGVKTGTITPRINTSINTGTYTTAYSLIGYADEDNVSTNVGTQVGGKLILDLRSESTQNYPMGPYDNGVGYLRGYVGRKFNDRITVNDTTIAYGNRASVTVSTIKYLSPGTYDSNGKLMPNNTLNDNNESEYSYISTDEQRATYNRILTELNNRTISDTSDYVSVVRFNDNISSLMTQDPTATTVTGNYFFFKYLQLTSEGETPTTGTLRMIPFSSENNEKNYFSIFRRKVTENADGSKTYTYNAADDLFNYILSPRGNRTNNIYLIEFPVTSEYEYFIGKDTGSGCNLAYMEFDGFSDTGGGFGEIRDVDFVYNDSPTTPYLPNHESYTYSDVVLTFRDPINYQNQGASTSEGVVFNRTASNAFAVTQPRANFMAISGSETAISRVTFTPPNT